MLIDIPRCLVEEALSCHFIQQQGSTNSIEYRSKDVERRQHHFSELVTAIIIKQITHQKRLPNTK